MKGLFVLLASLVATAASAQVTTPAAPNGVDVIVIAATGDPTNATTTPPIATRNTALAPGSPLCNLVALPVPVPPLVNPTIAEIPDPFTPGRFCRPPMPVNLATATALRVVAQFQSAAGPSGRSPVGDFPFNIQPILVPPAAPASVGVRP